MKREKVKYLEAVEVQMDGGVRSHEVEDSVSGVNRRLHTSVFEPVSLAEFVGPGVALLRCARSGTTRKPSMALPNGETIHGNALILGVKKTGALRSLTTLEASAALGFARECVARLAERSKPVPAATETPCACAEPKPATAASANTRVPVGHCHTCNGVVVSVTVPEAERYRRQLAKWRSAARRWLPSSGDVEVAMWFETTVRDLLNEDGP